jgi:hypothetical protein
LFKQGSATQDYRLRNRDESYRWIRDEQRLVCNAHGEPVEVVGSWTDITERKNLEDQLRQALKPEASARPAGAGARDFNELLTVIIGYSQLTEQSDSLSPEMRELLDHVLGPRIDRRFDPSGSRFRPKMAWRPRWGQQEEAS